MGGDEARTTATEISAEQICGYVADLATELHRLAYRNGFVVLAALLNLVQAEAERLSREARAMRSR
jgi:hypothetical protein